MTIIYGVTLVSILLYASLIVLIQNCWRPTEYKVVLPSDLPYVSVIIAARNEEDKIKDCLDSLALSTYPSDRYEVIVIDDMSTDQTAQIVRSHSCKCVTLYQLNQVTKHGSKKQALAYAAHLAKGQIWMYTDADSLVPSNWISKCVTTFSSTPETKVILGPVSYTMAQNPTINRHNHSGSNLSTALSKWQQLDIMGMMAVTNAGIYLQQWYIGNGANLALRATLWKQVGYPLNTDHKFASGDDVTLVQGAADLNKDSIQYLLDTDYIVQTSLQPDFTSLSRQRLRWTSKNHVQSSIPQKAMMATTWLFCLWTLIMGVLSVMHWQYFTTFLLLVFCKAIIDTIYLSRVQEFFGSRITGIWMAILSPVHTLYIALFGLLAVFPQRYTWKGRSVR